jgi:dolichol-phosphate mannosyltransferase
MAVMQPLSYAFEIILVNDGSERRTTEILSKLCEQYDEVKVVHLSRNFGHQAALTAGMDHARGDATIVMDADLQHPPELLPEMIQHWEAGYDIVYTIRSAETAPGFFKKWSAHYFYRFLNFLSESPIPANASDFRLTSKAASNAITQLRERTRFIRGISQWVGFRQIAIHYQPHERMIGTSKYSLRKMLNLALDGLISMSAIPLRSSLLVGFFLSIVGFLYMTYVVMAYFLTSRAVTGWSSLIIITLLMGGLHLNMIGVLGLYIAKIFDEVKQRPIYIVREKEGFLTHETNK